MNTYNYAIVGESFICYQSDGATVYYSIPLFYPVININSDTIAFSEDNYTIFKLKYSSFIQLELSNGTILTKSDFQNSNALFSQISSLFAITSSGGSASWGGITGNLNAQTDLQAALNAKADKSLASLSSDGLISKELYGKIINANSLFALSDSDIDTLLPPGNLSTINDPVTGISTLNAIKMDDNFVNATSFLRVEQKDVSNNTINATLFLPDYLNYTGEIYDWANRNLIKVTNHASSIYNLNIVTGGSFSGVRTKIKRNDGSLSEFINNILPNETITIRWSFSRKRFEEQ